MKANLKMSSVPMIKDTCPALFRIFRILRIIRRCAPANQQKNKSHFNRAMWTCISKWTISSCELKDLAKHGFNVIGDQTHDSIKLNTEIAFAPKEL